MLMREDEMAYRIFKVGSRVALRGLVWQGEGVVTKIGRERATVHLDKPLLDGRCKEARVKADETFPYKHLRLLEA
jgi:hypothetical protein